MEHFTSWSSPDGAGALCCAGKAQVQPPHGFSPLFVVLQGAGVRRCQWLGREQGACYFSP